MRPLPIRFGMMELDLSAKNRRQDAFTIWKKELHLIRFKIWRNK